MPRKPQHVEKEIRSGIDSLRIRLAWKEYFAAFCGKHGDPVPDGNRLLFPDGWGYAMAHEGPEYPPPVHDDGTLDLGKLAPLVKRYWTVRRRIVAAQATWLEREYKGFRELQASRSLPLVSQSTSVTYDEAGKPTRRRDVKQVDLEDMAARLDLLRAEVEECDRQLGEERPCDKQTAAS